MVTDPFVVQLHDLCRAFPTRTKWVFVPTHALGVTLGERLAREGTDWVNLRFVTPLALATDTAMPFLLERELEPADDELGPALVLDLLQDLPPAVPAYFRKLPPHPLLGEALWRSLKELRLAGITSDSLPVSAFGDATAKHAELQALLAGFEAFLSARRLADPALVYAEAARRPEWCPVNPGDLRLDAPDVVWAPLVRRFLDSIPGERMAPSVARLAGVSDPRRMAGRPRHAAEPVSPLAWLRMPDAMASALVPPGGSLGVFSAGGREAEIEEVLRRVLSPHPEAAPLDAVEIACVSHDDAWLVWLKARRYGLPVTVAGGVPLEAARPARALLAWCEWVEDGFPASGLRRMLQSGDVVVDLPARVSPGTAARLLLTSEATWGRDTYRRALGALAARSREAAANVEADDQARARAAERAAQAEALGGWIDGLIAAVPEPVPADPSPGPGSAVIDRGRLMTAALAFVREHGRVVDGVDRAARAACEAALARLHRQGSGACSLADGLTFVRAALVSRRVCAEGPRPGSLHVAQLDHAGLAGRPLTFVIGLEEGRVFPQPFEDPVLLDHERAGVHPDLPRSQDRVDEAVWAVLSRLAALPWPAPAAAAPGRGGIGPSVCLSYSVRDLRENRPTLPSWLVRHAYRLMPNGEVPFEAFVGEPVSVVCPSPHDALAESGWWLTTLKQAGPDGRQAVAAAFPALAQGEAAEAARDSDTFTEYDGHVPAAGPALDPRQSGEPVSATSIERLGECPFRYFLERGLGLEPIDEDDDGDDVWLDALGYGSLMHSLYADVMREGRARGIPVTSAAFGAWMHARAEERLAALRETNPPPSPQVFDAERDRVLRDVGVFLRLEESAAGEGRTPVAFEVGFGVRRDADEQVPEPFGQGEPVAISVGGRDVRFRGRIDRIDRLVDGRFEVTDYKTGGFYKPKYKGVFSRGRLFQPVVYALVAERLLRRSSKGATVRGGRYYFPTAKGEGAVHPVARPPAATTDAVLSALFDVAAGGAFLAAPVDDAIRRKDGDPCSLCELGGACGFNATGRAHAKFRDSSARALDPLRRLREAE